MEVVASYVKQIVLAHFRRPASLTFLGVRVQDEVINVENTGVQVFWEFKVKRMAQTERVSCESHQRFDPLCPLLPCNVVSLHAKSVESKAGQVALLRDGHRISVWTQVRKRTGCVDPYQICFSIFRMETVVLAGVDLWILGSADPFLFYPVRLVLETSETSCNLSVYLSTCSCFLFNIDQTFAIHVGRGHSSCGHLSRKQFLRKTGLKATTEEQERPQLPFRSRRLETCGFHAS
mmetsp:Transcript_10915/g.67429  ORF Transcript_10915/g.67429 Transcript_10915/m.67429 type:complete len:234 (+) Transcript_10915:4850-5551(+)